MLFYVTNVDTLKKYAFCVEGSKEAMEQMRYYLNLSKKDINAKILSTNSGKCWYMEHCGQTYSIVK